MEQENKAINELMGADRETLMLRLDGLSAVLEGLGIENDVVFRTESVPCILAQAGDEMIFQFTYIPAEELEEGGYFLNLTAQFFLGDIRNGTAFCTVFNADSRIAQANFNGLNDEAILRAVLPEPDGLTSGSTLKFYWDTFRNDVLQFGQMYQETLNTLEGKEK